MMKQPTVKDLITHNQVQSLVSLFTMLHSSISSHFISTMDGPVESPCSLPEAAKSAVEVALIGVANRISEIANDPARWTIDKSAQDEYNKSIEHKATAAEAAMLAQLFGFMPGLHDDEDLTNKPKGKKKGENEQQ